MIEADFHIHSKYSLGWPLLKAEPIDILKEAIRRNLKIISISDHNTLKGSLIGEQLARGMNDVIKFIKGEEISTSKGHLLALGIGEEIQEDYPLKKQ